MNVSSNILGGATQGGVYFHQGGLNTAQNNIIVDGTQYQVRQRSTCEVPVDLFLHFAGIGCSALCFCPRSYALARQIRSVAFCATTSLFGATQQRKYCVTLTSCQEKLHATISCEHWLIRTTTCTKLQPSVDRDFGSFVVLNMYPCAVSGCRFWCTDPSVDVLRNSSLFPLGGDGGLEAWRLASEFDAHSIVAGASEYVAWSSQYS
eukprot:COSAG05_NODE_3103_length_2321_cov_1.295680_2_plen_206_part_00